MALFHNLQRFYLYPVPIVVFIMHVKVMVIEQLRCSLLTRSSFFKTKLIAMLINSPSVSLLCMALHSYLSIRFLYCTI